MENVEIEEIDWLSVFKQLNDWLDPNCKGHWKLQQQLREIGIPQPPIFKRWLKLQDFDPFFIKHLELNQQYCLRWCSVNASPDEMRNVEKIGDLILGIRWKSESNLEKVEIRSSAHVVSWFRDIQPFQLVYPYHMDWCPFDLQVRGPVDLEFLWCFSNIQHPKGVNYIDRLKHQEKFKSVLKSIQPPRFPVIFFNGH